VNKYDGFENLQDIKESFECDCDGLLDEEVLFASYDGGNFRGEAIVLIQRDGKLYTSEGCHCSCNGLEGCWEMIETTKELLKKRNFKPYHLAFSNFLEGFLSDDKKP
jgi:hypothetical protein